ncbi:MAG: RNA polymerase sigma factor [Armatimonadetes bacterium]|nr:RNA polymerase sigma factor [Armatimonadota bacterium]
MVAGKIHNPNAVDIERLTLKHRDAVYRQMVRVCGNHDDAEDALADALLAAFSASHQLHDPTKFRAWIATIGKRVCAKKKIRERLKGAVSLELLQGAGFDPVDQSPEADEVSVQHQMQRCVKSAYEALPPIYQEVFRLRDIQGHSNQKVADELRISLPAVKSRLLRARSMLRKNLDSGFECSNLFESA